MTKSVAAELAAHCIRVNAVAKNPLGWTVEPEEIAGQGNRI